MNAIRYLLENNTPQTFGLALAVAVALFLALLYARRLVRTRLAAFARSTRTQWDEVAVDILGSTRAWMLAGVAILVGILNLDAPEDLRGDLTRLVMAMFFLQVGLWASQGVKAWLQRRMKAQLEQADGEAATSMAVIGFILQVVLWAIILILILDHLGFNVATLVASLGVGGIAVALAVQNILGDLFASLSISLDKPFVIGDFIVIGDIAGTVEHVGLKTTRIRSLSGEQIVMANGDLLGSRIRNYKRMAQRRIVFAFGVTYDTPADKLERLPAIVREIIEGLEDVRFDRAHFRGFGASSLDFEVVYYVLVADYNRYMDLQQAINLALVRRLGDEGVEFAFPTQTLHIASLPAGVADAAPAPAAG